MKRKLQVLVLALALGFVTTAQGMIVFAESETPEQAEILEQAEPTELTDELTEEAPAEEPVIEEPETQEEPAPAVQLAAQPAEAEDGQDDPEDPPVEPEPEVLDGIVANEDGSHSLYENGTMVTGKVFQYNGAWYAADAAGMLAKSKWITLAGSTYYAGANEKLYAGKKKIGSKSWYFDPSTCKAVFGKFKYKGEYYIALKKKGIIKNQYKRLDGKLYYASKSGKLYRKTIKTIKKHRYYFGKYGYAVTGKFKFKKKYFIAGKTGIIKTGWIKYKKHKYYADKKGHLVTGWKALEKNKEEGAYYFKETKKLKTYGQMASNEKVGYLKVPKDGNAGQAYVYGIKVLDKRGWDLYEAYKYSYKLHYAHRWMRKKTSEAYACYAFTHGQGNCYCMAATFYVMAKLLGYNIHQVAGYVVVPHSWTEVVQGGKTYVYDPNFRNETGRNGWKIWYGKKGTWRYSGWHRMN